jgi:peptide chain release factor
MRDFSIYGGDGGANGGKGRNKADIERNTQGPPPPVVLDEDDIVETFVRGSGPGGQKINKTASCVMLRHIPTGIVIRCQEGRSQYRNREMARKILRDKLDFMLRGEFSRQAMEANKEKARKAVKRKKAVKKAYFKSRRDMAEMS